ncbi:MAG: helix-turn-helix domain-containing protein [Candidatus Binatia bacterium]
MASHTGNKWFKKDTGNVISRHLRETSLERQRLLCNLGRVIRDARKQLKMTQEELAEAAEINPKYLGEVELGRSNPSVGLLFQISKALQLELADLFLVSQTRPGIDITLYKTLMELLRILEEPEMEKLKRFVKMIVD